jgi:hypothetical protein
MLSAQLMTATFYGSVAAATAAAGLEIFMDADASTPPPPTLLPHSKLADTTGVVIFCVRIVATALVRIIF